MKQSILKYVVVLVVLAQVAPQGVSAASSNSSYTIVQDRINNGGAVVSEGPYLTMDHIGQPVSGQFNSASHSMSVGFLHTLLANIVKLGDINGDGSINLQDVIIGLQILTGGDPSGISTAGDVNTDNRIGLEEILYNLDKVSTD